MSCYEKPVNQKRSLVSLAHQMSGGISTFHVRSLRITQSARFIADQSNLGSAVLPLRH